MERQIEEIKDDVKMSLVEVRAVAGKLQTMQQQQLDAYDNM